MVRHYIDVCVVCGNDLPKGPTKLKRHFEKHPKIFADRERQRSGASTQ